MIPLVVSWTCFKEGLKRHSLEFRAFNDQFHNQLYVHLRALMKHLCGQL